MFELGLNRIIKLKFLKLKNTLNIPFIVFCKDGTDHLRDSAIPFYNLLQRVGIIHFSVESSVNKINEIWYNVDEWWKNENLQTARKKFCKQYSRSVNNPALHIKEIILSDN